MNHPVLQLGNQAPYGKGVDPGCRMMTFPDVLAPAPEEPLPYLYIWTS